MTIIKDGKICDTELSSMVDKLRLSFLNSYARAMFESVSMEEIMALCQIMMLSVQNHACSMIIVTAIKMKKAKREAE